MSHAFRTSCVSLVLAVVTIVSAWAQSGTLTGAVTAGDPSIVSGRQRPLAGAIVTVLTPSNVEAARTTVRADGTYRVAGLTPGTYTVRCRRSGTGRASSPAR